MTVLLKFERCHTIHTCNSCSENNGQFMTLWHDSNWKEFTVVNMASRYKKDLNGVGREVIVE